MTAQLQTNRQTREPALNGSVSAFCSLLDRAITPLGTLSFSLGLVASIAGVHKPADHLMAAGVLFHLVPYLSDWLSPNADLRRIQR